MRKSWITGAFALTATAALLAGCSGGGDATTDDDGGDAVDASGVELTVWVDENREPAVAAAAEQFETDTGATVTLVQKDFADLRADFLAQVPTGEGPDMTIGAHDWLGEFVASGVVNTLDLGEKASEFEPVALEAMTYDGQLYALPYSLETVALIQNTELVGEEAPATWEDMIAAGEESGAERPFVINTEGQTGDGYTMYGFQTSFGAPVFVQDESGSYTSEVGMAGPEGEAFAQWLSENGEDGAGYLSTTIDYDINNELFNSGEAAYTVQGPWAIASFPDVDVAVNPIPSAGGEPAAPFVGVQGFYLSSQSENALIAQEFLVNYIATEEAQRALYEADPRIPAWSTVAEEVSSDPIIAGFLASSQNGVPMPSIPEMGSVWEYWNAAEAQIIAGADPVSTWNTMIEDLNATLGG
ncbi:MULTISPECIES: maltose ABC transporter substrate-binding protein [Microbacterium]|uniref:sugar ABC transporter substrate-binding protein n=1 Tax=Microbacterium TaxID=33882 RepID=UPI0008D9033C|nr:MULTISPECIES: maltose ABC transporter substrate-binding protein [Microbacterium]MAY49322.1 maltose ABC transporter substrate-binding protein [Microbacterium sp.]HAS32802.1 maltose ABC transporter substrate-binding protein [Microbacterium sp.]HBR90126.1 maltose ABC transporter substrate-binding protein [Microbacterium sp.]HBS73729.1 maltose ABC transporter substrate-binding protein [Microbacterium sp.]|tara:strand:+ start:903 stop:2144 length:1242 start_codon:yes stop_codon:yes gene_type:complete